MPSPDHPGVKQGPGPPRVLHSPGQGRGAASFNRDQHVGVGGAREVALGVAVVVVGRLDLVHAALRRAEGRDDLEVSQQPPPRLGWTMGGGVLISGAG